MRESTRKIVMALLVVTLLTSVMGTMATMTLVGEPYNAVKIGAPAKSTVSFGVGSPTASTTAAATAVGQANVAFGIV